MFKIFKDKQAREEIEKFKEELKELKRLLGFIPERKTLHGYCTLDKAKLERIDKLFKLASTLGYEYKEESKEAGWVKKEEKVDGGLQKEYMAGREYIEKLAFEYIKPKKTKRNIDR